MSLHSYHTCAHTTLASVSTDSAGVIDNNCVLTPVVDMATGSLADQVTYPTKIDPEKRTIETEKRLQELLELVPTPSKIQLNLPIIIVRTTPNQ